MKTTKKIPRGFVLKCIKNKPTEFESRFSLTQVLACMEILEAFLDEHKDDQEKQLYTSKFMRYLIKESLKIQITNGLNKKRAALRSIT